MKTKFYSLIGSIAIAALSFAPVIVKAQEQQMQFFRPNNKLGVNVFETSKKDTVKFTGLKVQIGGGFTMNYQSLRASNTATPVMIPVTTTKGTTIYNSTALTPLINGFNLPMANLSFDVQLADGVRLNLTSYLASRHHEETWVKGGYIQIDKVEFLHSELLNQIMKSVTVTIGESDIDYGDQHYRRSDGGNTIYNPFVENYIMDEFSTEIGMHIYYKCAKTGLFAMGAITNGELNPTTIEPTSVDAETGKTNKFPPAFLGKLGFDKQVNTDLRVRVTGSFYTVSSANSSTLFGGDRSGSNYFNVFSTPYAAATTTTTQAIDYNAFSGRFNPGFSEENHSFMGNLFLKYKGLEFFGTAETAKGRVVTEVSNRNAKQFAGDVIYRFPEGKENFWVGYRYNTVKATIIGNSTDVTVNRNVGSAGWFLTKNIMMRGEYVDQKYKDFDATSIYHGGEFKGFMVSAVVGF